MFITKKKLEKMLADREMKGYAARTREDEIREIRSEMYRMEEHLKREINKVARGMAEMEHELHPEKNPHGYCPFEIVKE